MIDIEKLEELEQAATKGPLVVVPASEFTNPPPPPLWVVAKSTKNARGTYTCLGMTCGENHPDGDAYADAALWASTINALPELLAEVRRLRACREALRLCLAEYVEEYGSASCDCEKSDCWVCKSVEALKATE